MLSSVPLIWVSHVNPFLQVTFAIVVVVIAFSLWLGFAVRDR